MQKITPHLWFDKQAREAAEFYVSLFPNSEIKSVNTLSDTPSGDCELVSFELAELPFMAISAGPLFNFNPTVSFTVECQTSDEVDDLWNKLLPGGKAYMPLDEYPFSKRYGWLQDRFGLSWQLLSSGENYAGQKLIPTLMFAESVCGRCEEAIEFYLSVFKKAPNTTAGDEFKAAILSRYEGGEEPDKEGSVRYARFSIMGQAFSAMDSARVHDIAFNEAISLLIPCDTQEGIDYFWNALSADKSAEQCGWLKDKFGLSWQISPTIMNKLLGGGDEERLRRVTQAFLKMKKFDIAAIERAAAGV